MLRNYLKVAIRSLTRNKLSSVINISGLALALTCCILLYQFIRDEHAFDKHHSKHERIFRVTRSFHSAEGEVSLHLAHVAPPVGPLLKNDFGQIESLARTVNFGMILGVQQEGKYVTMNQEDRVFLTEPAIFSIFDIEILKGNPANSLTRPFTIMLSESMAMKYFNSLDVTGKILRGNDQFDLEVTGVYRDFPLQSHWHPEFLVSFSTLEDERIYGRSGLETNWGNNSFGTYLLLTEGAKPEALQAELVEFMDKHFGNFVRGQGAPPDFKASKVTSLYLQKVTDIHMRSHLDDEVEANGSENSVYMMGAIGVFIIFIACFNFINLSTARATKRAKEVGLRKVVGAFRSQLVMQYLSESILTALVSLGIALALAGICLGWLNEFTNKNLSFSLLLDPLFLGGLSLFAILLGILAGVYPAFIVSSFRPALTLKGSQASVKGKLGLRRGLVVTQFAISIILMIATIITFQQLNYLNNEELGYEKEQILTLPLYEDLNATYDAFYNEITRSSQVQNAARSSRVPTGRLLDSYGNARVVDGDSLVNTNVSLKTIAVDDEFFATYQVKILAGRSFSKDIPGDDSLSFIINETAARQFGWENPVDHVNEEFQYAGVNGKLIGVVKDFHFESLHQEIAPMIFVNNNRFNSISVRITGNTTEAIAGIEKVWKEFLPGGPFNFQFLSERYALLYEAEQKQGQLFTVFSGLAIFIASLGLFGLATFNTMQRVKEIGIRKVLGAGVPHILGLLSKEIVILILVANLVAWPVAWYMMSDWLDSFAYHIDMNVWIYLLSAVAALVLAVLTVSFQTIRAAMANPAKTLKYE